MKKFLLMMVSIILLTTNIKAHASEPEFVKIRCTCYCWTGNVARYGGYPYEGIIYGRYEDLGDVVIAYEVAEDGSIGDYIGIFEYRDTGSANTLVNGTSIDMYRDTLDRCYDWVDSYGDYVYILRVHAVG